MNLLKQCEEVQKVNFNMNVVAFVERTWKTNDKEKNCDELINIVNRAFSIPFKKQQELSPAG